MSGSRRLLIFVSLSIVTAWSVTKALAANPPAIAERNPSGQSSQVIRRYGSSAYRQFASQLEYRSDGRWIGALRMSRSFHLIDAKTGETKFECFPQHFPLRAFAFSPDGQSVAIYDPHGITFWDIKSGTIVGRKPRERKPREANYRGFVSSPDRHWRAAWNDRKREIAFGKWDQFEPEHRIPFQARMPLLCIGKGGKWLAATDGRRSPSIRFWKTPQFDSPLDWSDSESPVISLASSSDGETLFAGCKDGSIQVWKIKRGRNKSRFRTVHSSPIISLVPSPDGKYLAAGMREATVIYETSSHRAIHSIEYDRIRSSHLCLAFSPDGTTLAIGSTSHPIELWDVKSGRAIHRQTPAVEKVFATGNPEVFGSFHDGDVYLWNLKTGNVEEQFPAGYRPEGGNFHYSGPKQGSEQIIFVGASDKVYYRDLADRRSFELVGWMPQSFSQPVACSGEGLFADLVAPSAIRLSKISLAQRHASPVPHVTLNGPASPCSKIGFSENGKTFVAAFEDASVFAWETEKGKRLQRLELKTAPKHMHVNADGHWLAVSQEKAVEVWDLKTGKRNCRIPTGKFIKPIWAFGFQSAFLALTSAGEPIQIWNVKTGKEISRLDPPEFPVESLAFTRDDKKLAAGLQDKSIRLFDRQTKKEVGRLEGHTGSVTHLRFHPDGKRLISASKTREILIWDMQAVELIRVQRGIRDRIEQLGLTADGQRVMVHPSDGDPFHFSIERAGSIVRPRAPAGYGISGDFAYSKATNRLAVPFTSGIRVMDQKAGRELPFIVERGSHRVEWAPDGRILVAASSDLVGFDVAQQEELYRVPQTQLHGKIVSLVKSPDGQTVATGIHGRGVSFWSLRTGRLIREVLLPKTSLRSIQFSPDGRLLFGLAYDKYFIIEVESGLVWYEKPIQHGSDQSFAQMGPHSLLSAESQGTGRLWSWAPKLDGHSETSVEKLWESLAKRNGPAVYRSMFALAELENETVKFLAEQLPQIETTSASPKKVTSLITDLEDSSPVVRRKASEKLRKLGNVARPHLQAALENDDLPRQARTRIQFLLSAQSAEPDSRLAMLRAIQLLEWIATPKAKKLLRELAGSDNPIGIKAQSALDRLSQPKE